MNANCCIPVVKRVSYFGMENWNSIKRPLRLSRTFRVHAFAVVVHSALLRIAAIVSAIIVSGRPGTFASRVLALVCCLNILHLYFGPDINASGPDPQKRRFVPRRAGVHPSLSATSSASGRRPFPFSDRRRTPSRSRVRSRPPADCS